jgi:hypothetical protein
MFSEFVKETYLPWSESHKASYGDDVRITTMLTDFFKDKTLTEIKPVLIEQFKAQRRKADKALATHQPRAVRIIQNLHRGDTS